MNLLGSRNVVDPEVTYRHLRILWCLLKSKQTCSHLLHITEIRRDLLGSSAIYRINPISQHLLQEILKAQPDSKRDLLDCLVVSK